MDEVVVFVLGLLSVLVECVIGVLSVDVCAGHPIKIHLDNFAASSSQKR